MDPEIYVFPGINQPLLKILASTALFVLVTAAARLLLPAGELNTTLLGGLTLVIGYAIFIYASYQAWRATREKNAVEDTQRERATCLLDTGFYASVRHPMYGLFILADAGLGLAAHSIYGLGFSLLALVLFILNGIFEERAVLIPQFGDAYRGYMRRVPTCFFTPANAALLVLALGLNIAGVFGG